MGIFSWLFNKNNEETFDYHNNRLCIDLSYQGININNKIITLPATMSDLTFLGKPRKIKTKVGVNYTWDDAGVYCYTRGKEKKVVCVGVAVKQGELELKTTPRSMYDGVLTINGRDWQTEIVKGEETEVLTQLAIGEYLVSAEYCNFMDSSAFSNIEFQKKDME